MQGDGDDLSVLVVDDNEGYASLASTRLERASPGIHADAETDPQSALERVADDGYDCVVADYRMPGMNGIEFAESVQEYRESVPVVLVTGRGSEAVASEAFDRGVADYHRKGTDDDPEELARSVRQAVENGRDNDRMTTFVRMASHDLRNPLSVAKGWLDLYHETGDEEAYERTRDALNRMEAILEDVEALARAEGDDAVVREALDLSSVATAAWEMVAPEDADLKAEYGPRVEADPSMLQAVLENLIDNAVTHGGDGVTVTVGELRDEAGFFVADDGAGIPPEDRERVFERGFSAGEGTGMGLAIVECIADAHGWSVELRESEAGGARFEFRGVTMAD